MTAVFMDEDGAEVDQLIAELRRAGFDCERRGISDRDTATDLESVLEYERGTQVLLVWTQAFSLWLGARADLLMRMLDKSSVLVSFEEYGDLPQPVSSRAISLTRWVRSGEPADLQDVATALRAAGEPTPEAPSDLPGLVEVRDGTTVRLGVAVDPGWVATVTPSDPSLEQSEQVHWAGYAASTVRGGEDGSARVLRIVGTSREPPVEPLGQIQVDAPCTIVTGAREARRRVEGRVVGDILEHTAEAEVPERDSQHIIPGSPVVQGGRVVGLVTGFRRDPGRVRIVPSRVFEGIRERTASSHREDLPKLLVERSRRSEDGLIPEDLLLGVMRWAATTGGRDSGRALLDSLDGDEDRLDLAAAALTFKPKDPLFDRDGAWAIDRSNDLARRLSYVGSVGMRHLAAVALVSGTLDAGFLAALGATQPGLRQTLQRYVDNHHRSERSWEDILAEDDWKGWATPFVPGEMARGFTSDLPPIEAVEDHLDLGVYVRMLGSVLADYETRLPLSVGLFGAWGTGKSHFMRLLEKELERLAAEERRERPWADGRTPTFCRNYRHITFNAWHFSDGNLWASLTEHVLRGLDVRTEVMEEILESADELRGRHAEASGARDALVAREQALQLEVAQIETRVANTQDAAVSLKEAAGAFGADFINEVLRDEQVVTARQGLDNVARSAGIDPGGLEPEEILQDVRSLKARATSIVTRIKERPGLWGAGAVVAVAVPLGAAALGAEGLARTYGLLVPLVALLSSCAKVIGDVGTSARSAVDRMDRIERRVLGQRMAAGVGDQVRLQELIAERSTLELERVEKEGEIQDLNRKLALTDPSAQFQSYVSEQLDAGGYDRELGVISHVRADFEALSIRLARMKNTSVEALDRIVLYIDDLDRCTPDRVVQVLEAVHLLLAFDLFVVVVGVDPGWLARSLEAERAAIVRIDRPGLEALSVSGQGTALDYLEKIFQIPFVLPAMDRRGLDGILNGLLQPGQQSEPNDGRAEEETDHAGGSGGSYPLGEGSVLSLEERETPTPPTMVDTNPGTAEPSTPVAAPIDLTPAELQFLSHLVPLVATPRAAKRLANLYRMVRASPELTNSDTFLGTPAEFEVLAELLAVVSAHPSLFGQIWSRSPAVRTGSSPRQDDSQDWAEFIKGLAPTPSETGWANAVAGDLRPGEVARWASLHRGLTEPALATARHARPVATYRGWARVVAHFSFDLSAVHPPWLTTGLVHGANPLEVPDPIP